jgi:hypothetical protein
MGGRGYEAREGALYRTQEPCGGLGTAELRFARTAGGAAERRNLVVKDVKAAPR